MNQESKFLSSTTYSISWLYNRHLANEIRVKPDFQRNPVWSDAQKSFLIDTILRGYPIPELYFQSTTDSEGKETHIVVDGQQRVRACLDFILGKLVLEGDEVAELEGLSFDTLTADQKKSFFHYKFVVRVLPVIDDIEIRAIFTRINRNVMNLNKQELRHATYWGPFIKLMEEISDSTVWTDIKIFTPNDIRRMLDVEYVSELAVAHMHGLQNKKDSLEEWYKIYESGFEDVANLRRRFLLTLEEIRSILGDEKTRFRKKSDFYTLFLIISREENQVPFTSDRRADVKERLIRFGSEVDAYIKAKPNTTPPSDEVGVYTRAVQKAASDRAARRARAHALSKSLDFSVGG